jgi:diadenosine tetraphosphate (Ap4A) HIT family hydrolase
MDQLECIGCDVNAGRTAPPGGVIASDGVWQADHEITPLVRGYVIVKPLRHVHELADINEDEADRMGRFLARLHSAMRSALATERIYVCSFAETVHHLHFHLIPRYADMPGLGPKLLPDVFSGRWSCTVSEAAEAARAIRRAFSEGKRLVNA